jgi:Spy/CpxP family protein refolding chaperone
MKTLALIVVSACAAVAVAAAQHPGHRGASPAPAPQTYAGQQSRAVSSLSADEVEGLLAGRGLGLARPAEVNGYPGPMHVLELAGELHLSPEQKTQVQASFDRMKARAMQAGTAYVAAESAVDAAFKSGNADRATIERLVREADARRAEKRLSHLEAHLEVTPLLTAVQRRRYAELRGYAGGPGPKVQKAPTHDGRHGQHPSR